jgi:hypothetical protein
MEGYETSEYLPIKGSLCRLCENKSRRKKSRYVAKGAVSLTNPAQSRSSPSLLYLGSIQSSVKLPKASLFQPTASNLIVPECCDT